MRGAVIVMIDARAIRIAAVRAPHSTMRRPAMKSRTVLTLAAMAGVAALVGCSGAQGDPAASGGEVTMTFWHNSTTGDGKAYWEDRVAAFEAANEGVTIEIQSIQNEDM